jgi:hypothetical protein
MTASIHATCAETGRDRDRCGDSNERQIVGGAVPFGMRDHLFRSEKRLIPN